MSAARRPFGQSPLMTMHEAAEYLRYPEPHGAHSVLRYFKRQGVPLEHRGRIPLVRREVVDAHLQQQADVATVTPFRRKRQ